MNDPLAWEGGDLRATSLRAFARPLSLLAVISLVATSMVLTTFQTSGASTGDARHHMPRVVGLTRVEVYAAMRADSLYFTTKGPGSSNRTWQTVIGQSPAAGVMVSWHATVTLTTSKRPYQGLRRVPRLIGLTKRRVFAAAKKADLYFTTRGPGSARGNWIRAVRQSPAPGTRVAWHSVVVVVTRIAKPRAQTRRPPTTTSTSSTTVTTVRATEKATTRVRPHSRVGVATWYRYFPGRCATWYLPRGTRIRVRDLQTGRTVSCLAFDREGARGDHVVDLSQTDFRRLEPLSRGVIDVKVTW